MANHTITIINRGSTNTTSSMQRSDSRTSATNRQANKNTKVTQSMWTSGKTNALAKRMSTVGAKAIGAALMVRIGINTFATVGSAATGDEMRYSNMQALTNMITNPLGFATNTIKQSIINGLIIERQNESLNYQRQLTGELVYSKKFNTGAF